LRIFLTCDKLNAMNVTMCQLSTVNLNEIEDDDLILFWDKSATASERESREKLLVDSSTKVIRIGDLKQYINYGTYVSKR